MLRIHECCRSGDLDGLKSIIYGGEAVKEINAIDENVLHNIYFKVDIVARNIS